MEISKWLIQRIKAEDRQAREEDVSDSSDAPNAPNEVPVGCQNCANPPVVANARYVRDRGASERGSPEGPDDQFNGDAKNNAKKLAWSCDHRLVPRSLRAKNPRRHDASWAEPQQSKRTREA